MFKSEAKKDHIIICRVISSHTGLMYIETPYIYIERERKREREKKNSVKYYRLPPASFHYLQVKTFKSSYYSSYFWVEMVEKKTLY